MSTAEAELPTESAATYDVAVIGYGPTGATAANLLGQMGLTVLVVERDPDVYNRARAISTDEGVMRIWQSVGLADRLAADVTAAAATGFPAFRSGPFAYAEDLGHEYGERLRVLERRFGTRFTPPDPQLTQ